MHERDTKDDILLRSDIKKPVNLIQKYNETTMHSMTTVCRRNYRNRIKTIIQFWKEEDPDYYDVGVQYVSESDFNNDSKYCFVKFKQDIRYHGINIDFVLHFLVSTKNKKMVN